MATGRRKIHDTSRRNEVFRGCIGKRRYTSKRMALGVLRVMRSQEKHVGTLHPYRCKVCKGWHLGNSRRRHEQEEVQPAISDPEETA